MGNYHKQTKYGAFVHRYFRKSSCVACAWMIIDFMVPGLSGLSCLGTVIRLPSGCFQRRKLILSSAPLSLNLLWIDMKYIDILASEEFVKTIVYIDREYH